MSRIPAGFGQLKKAFEAHWKIGEENYGQSCYLLRFYSVECGLKSMYIHKYDKSHITNSEGIPDLGHKLDQWIKKLNVPASQIGQPPRFKMRRGGLTEPKRNIERIHEAWRYGVAVDQDDEVAILKWLDDVSSWIRDNLKEA